ncbi:hypothetical protein HOF92_02585 [bacterium]|jgi:hypothetical protein|nr:hypothetical protein [bacterium]
MNKVFLFALASVLIGTSVQAQEKNKFDSFLEQYPELQAELQNQDSRDAKREIIRDYEQANPEFHKNLQDFRDQNPRPRRRPAGNSQARVEFLNANPEIKAQFDQWKSLSAEDSKVAMENWALDNPALAQKLADFQAANSRGNRRGSGQNQASQARAEFFNANPQIKEQFEKWKGLSNEERRNAMQEWTLENPALAQKLTDFQAANGRGQGKGRGRNSQARREFIESNPDVKTQLESMKGLSREERHEKMKAWRQTNPEQADQLKEFRRGRGGHRGNRGPRPGPGRGGRRGGRR